MPGPEIERQGLLQPEAFDIDDVESIDPPNGNSRNQSQDWSKSRRSRSTVPARWIRPRYIVCGLVTIAALLMIGVAWNKGAGIKIPKLIKPSPSAAPALPETSETPDGPHHPKEPLEDISSELPGDLPTPSPQTSAISAENSLALENEGQVQTSATFEAQSTSDAAALSSTSTSHASYASSTLAATLKDGWEKPSGFKIIGLIFFGRPPVVDILDCYLKKNLVSNGGWLDEVHFVVNTMKEKDIAYLDMLIETADEYKKKTLKSLGYNEIWKTVEPEHMYIKIDDDIVYFDDNAIPNLIYTKLHHNNSFNVVANLVNSPETGWLHYRVGAIHSYLPELERPEDPKPESMGEKAWRASELPTWKGASMDWPIAGVRAGKDDDGSALPPGVPGAPPYIGHRWLPLRDDGKYLDKTPMWESHYDPNGPDWGSWSLGAQAHYSFLENLENGELSRYHYGHGLNPEREGIWNMMYFRMNINFMAIWGKDVLDNLPFETGDDERELSMTIPKKVGKPLLINTHAIAAHFSFRSQLEMYQTDLLNRYRAYANENRIRDAFTELFSLGKTA